jgi:asparagine synthase (glutamine-hydrolysing)
VHHLRGVFAFVIYDARDGSYFVARDPIGVNPLYVGWRADGAVVYASEMKVLAAECVRFECFPNGSSLKVDAGEVAGEPARWYDPTWWSSQEVPTKPYDPKEFRAAFEDAVTKRMMSDVPWGVLLSGGLDSSLVASIASRHAARRVEDDSAAWWPRMHSFSIGLKGSPDLAAAQKVADYLGTAHHSIEFTVQQGLDSLVDVIYHLETYDTTTVRASTPMYLMARKIKALGVKMVLSGEGADEVFGGYLYFHKAPDAEEFHRETVRKIKELWAFDCLRANKSMAAFGVEVRVPFLDRDFLDLAYSLDPNAKLCGTSQSGRKKMEKWLIRSAFDTAAAVGSDDGGASAGTTEAGEVAGAKPYLPEEVLWRQKEQFSDGVGYNWIDSLRAYAAKEVTDAQFAARKHRFPVNPPATKEAYHYRSIFESHFPGRAAAETVPQGASVACSTAKAVEWDEEFQRMAAATAGECSGRAIAGVHDFAYDDAVAEALAGLAETGAPPSAAP